MSHDGLTDPTQLHPAPPMFFFVPYASRDDDYDRETMVTDIFAQYTVGFVSGRDESLIGFDGAQIRSLFRKLADSAIKDSEILEQYRITDTSGWPVSRRRRKLIDGGFQNQRVRQIAYRPFDARFTYFDHFLQRARYDTFKHLLQDNLALITSRLIKGEKPAHVFVSRLPVEKIFLSPKTSNNAFAFPLYVYDSNVDAKLLTLRSSDRRPNLASSFVHMLSAALGLEYIGEGTASSQSEFGPEDVLHFIYAVCHSPSYRSRYAEFLKIDFPRLPLTSSLELFRALAKLGGELVALHLMESPKLEKHITKYVGKGDSEVAKGHPKYSAETVSINPTKGFEGVPENVWNFHIGGYQVCEKWLKDRRGRTLSDEDILHYQRIVVALNETIRLMAEIDKVIDAHGGWPGAFVTEKNS